MEYEEQAVKSGTWSKVYAHTLPLHVLGDKISVSDIEGLKILKLSQHPQIILQIEVMKDTFDMSDWWKTNCELPVFTYVLRAVLTKSQFSKRPHQ